MIIFLHFPSHFTFTFTLGNKMSPYYLFFVFLALFVDLGSAAKSWCYEDPKCGPDTWGGECRTGTKQSPIDLPYNPSGVQPPTVNLYQNSEYTKSQDFFIVNNGHTVEVSLSRDLKSAARIYSRVFGEESYIFSQLHFHWGDDNGRGSEHTLNNKNSSMEAHLVHYRQDFNSLQDAIASNETGAVVVVGRFFNVSESGVDSEALAPIVRTFLNPERATWENSTGTNLTLPLFYDPVDDRKLIAIHYEGSLTTPDCSQVVLWSVFIDPAPISRIQIEVFRSLKIPHTSQRLVNNFRPIQATNSRVTETVQINVK